MTNMSTNITAKFSIHNKHATRLLVALLIVVLISSLLLVGLFLMTNSAQSPDGMVHVKNEKELTKAINKAKKPTTITLDNDITLTKPMIIPNNKNITLTSNTTTTSEEFFKLIGAKDQTTIHVNHGGILHLAGIIVTHNMTTIYLDYESGIGVNVADGGKLFMTDGEISNNHGYGYDYGGGVAVHKGGFFEMTGGIIVNNDARTHGGGVGVLGVFNMSGSAIIANNAAGKNGWGVYVYFNGTFNMAGNAVITNNNSGAWASCMGCGVFNAGTFVMLDNSVIANNYASGGGGVCNEGLF
jgi:hypothetical protein